RLACRHSIPRTNRNRSVADPDAQLPAGRCVESAGAGKEAGGSGQGDAGDRVTNSVSGPTERQDHERGAARLLSSRHRRMGALARGVALLMKLQGTRTV